VYAYIAAFSQTFDSRALNIVLSLHLLCLIHTDAIHDRLFGFLLGTATAGAGMYYYVIDEYRVSNQLLTEDIYALQSAVQRIEGYVRTLEEKVAEKKR
jgi:hypothetical protein